MRELERQAALGDTVAQARLDRANERIEDPPEYGWIEISGETFAIEDVRSDSPMDGLAEIETREGESFILAPDSETAGNCAALYWREMAEHDPQELVAIVGEQNLVAWAIGQPAGPGLVSVTSFEEWLGLWVDTPEEQWACYDGEERDIDSVSEELTEEVGFTPTVAYRSN